MVAKKKAPVKKAPAKRAPAAKKTPLHPMRKDLKDWNRDKVMDHVCDELATSSKGLGSIISAARDSTGDFPSYSTIMKWLEDDAKLSERYARAKAAQADFMADELLEIADSSVETVTDQNGVSRKDSADVQHKRLRVDTRKWLAAKLKPKVYGDKLQQEVTGKDGGPIKTETTWVIQPVKSSARTDDT